MIYYNTDSFTIENKTAVTIGNFDGLHNGHKALFSLLREQKERGFKTAALSFYPHPLAVLKGIEVKNLFTSHEKREILSLMEIDYYIEYPFTHEFAALSPWEFAEKILAGKLNARAVVVGEGYRFGRNKSGDLAQLREYGRKLGFAVLPVAHIGAKGEKISSTHIRRLIAKGDMEGASRLLGRNYFAYGQIKDGGSGFFTVNITSAESKLLPPDGGYFTEICIRGRVWPSLTVINGDTMTTNISVFSEKASGENVRVDFLKANIS